MFRNATLLGPGTGISRSVVPQPIGRLIGLLAATALIFGLAATAEAWPSGTNTSPESPAQEKQSGPENLRRTEARLRDAAQENREASLALPKIGGWVMLADNVTLIVALPDKAQLAYIDTLEAREMKRVELPFKPDLLAVQGKSLFASVYGGSAIHVLDLGSGADRKEYRLPTGPVMGLTCHREKGPLFASISDPTMIPTIVVVDPISGAIAYAGRVIPGRMDPAKVHGQTLAADPVRGDDFFSLVPIIGGRHATPGMGVQRVAVRGMVPFQPSKGSRSGTPHRDPQAMPAGRVSPVAAFLSSQKVAKANSPIHASGSGGSVGVIDIDGKGIVVLSARDLDERVGVIDCPSASDFAFHPTLDLVAAEGCIPGHERDRGLTLFNGKSLVEITRFPLGPAKAGVADPDRRLLTFCARGTRLAFYESTSGHRLRFFPLPAAGKDGDSPAKATGDGREQ